MRSVLTKNIVKFVCKFPMISSIIVEIEQYAAKLHSLAKCSNIIHIHDAILTQMVSFVTFRILLQNVLHEFM